MNEKTVGSPFALRPEGHDDSLHSKKADDSDDCIITLADESRTIRLKKSPGAKMNE